MALCPRRQPGSILQHSDDDDDIGIVELNGCLLAGTAMVKTRDEWTFLRDGEGRIDGVLRDVGFSTNRQGKEGGHVDCDDEDEVMSRRAIGGAKETKI